MCCNLREVTFFVLLLQFALMVRADDGYSSASIKLGDDWWFHIYNNGSAKVAFGPMDAVLAKEGTFDNAKWSMCIRASIEAARKKNGAEDIVGRGPGLGRAGGELMIGVTEGNEFIATNYVAMLTPELKEYVDRTFEIGISTSDRVRALTNRYPIFTKGQMASILQSSGSNFSSALVSGRVGVTAPGGSMSKEITTPPKAKIEPSTQQQPPEPTDSGTKGGSLGFRRWLVIGLLAIAAFLTYRFIKLRLGS